jgi:hypothetical protein
MNLQLDQAQKRHDMSRIGVTDSLSNAVEDYTTYGLYLISRGKKRLTHLVVMRQV